MQIKKSDLLNFIKTIQNHENENIDRKNSQTLRTTETKIKHQKYPLTLDKLRSQIASLNMDLKKIQSVMTNKQTQLEFLNSLGTEKNWQENLVNFLKRISSDPLLLVNKSIRLHEYKLNLENDLKELLGALAEKEIKMQNIFSAGIIKDPKGMLRSIIQTKEMFGNIKTQYLQQLLR